ncbi:MAG: 2-C-methyl-D-erythritol 2,4-cyclodiphosphate synthase [Porticoccaceae bacterium]|nr:2-C-methyl-D-erythritol 2,4-cyclodiphosphate synthase [Porticoccaceae bacterium]
MRIGQGYDVHAFGEGSSLTIGGVVIPFERTLVAHSDGDVLIHALMDAILGALALGDIGHHFPDTGPQYKGCSSRDLLVQIYQLMTAKGYQLGNADITLVAEAPKMAPHLQLMIDNLAQDLRCTANQLNIKATTTERLGFTGRGEGIACYAVVLLTAKEV